MDNNFLEKHKTITTWMVRLLPFVLIAAVSFSRLFNFIRALPNYLPIDDSYIILNFARNALERHEFFSYNPGEISTGITAPLYCLLLSFSHALHGGANWNIDVTVVGTICYVSSFILGSLVAYRIKGYVAAVIFSLLFGLWGYLAFFAFCGMEPILYIALGLAAILSFFRKRYGLAGFFVGLATLCRPEGVFLLFVLGLDPALSLVFALYRKDRVAAKKHLFAGIRLAGFFFMIVFPWALWCKHISGDFMPSTVAMKTHRVPFSETAKYWWSALRMYNPSAFDTSLVVSQIGETAFMKFRRVVPLFLFSLASIPFLRKQPRNLLPLLYMPVHILVAGFKNPIFADNERYFPFDYTLTLMYLSVFLAGLWHVDFKGRLSKLALAGGRVGFCKLATKVLTMMIAMSLAVMMLFGYSHHIKHYRMMSQYFYMLDYQIGEALAKHTPPSTRVALYQAGGIGFFGRRYIIDGGGVTEHTIWPYIRGEKTFGQALVDRDADFIASFGDDWLKNEGLLMTDTRFFTQIPLRCRGLYKINKPALREYIKGKAHSRIL